MLKAKKLWPYLTKIWSLPSYLRSRKLVLEFCRDMEGNCTIATGNHGYKVGPQFNKIPGD